MNPGPYDVGDDVTGSTAYAVAPAHGSTATRSCRLLPYAFTPSDVVIIGPPGAARDIADSEGLIGLTVTSLPAQ
jgi:hypothetical protein